MQGKYILQCDVDDTIRDQFVQIVKAYKRQYVIVYNRIPDGSHIITFNDVVFEEFTEFLDHVEGTSGGYDGVFGYSREATK